MKYLAGAGSVILILILGGLIYIYSGIFNISATVPHSKITLWAINTTKDRSIAHYADNSLKVPDLLDSSTIKMGFVHYRKLCAGCHGAPGVERDATGQGLYPRGPNLSRSASEFTPQQLFYMTKNGIKMSGMPAFGKTQPDDKIWSIVAFTKKLPLLTKEQYREYDKVTKGENDEYSH